MRTNIDIDDEVMQRALALTGAATKREAVDRALREMVERRERAERQRAALEELRGIAPDWGADLPEDDPRIIKMRRREAELRGDAER